MVSLGVSGDGFTGLGFSEPPPPEPQAEINSTDNAEIKKCLFIYEYSLTNNKSSLILDITYYFYKYYLSFLFYINNHHF